MVAGGWTPNIALLAQARGRLRYDSASAGFTPGTLPKGIHVVGAASGAHRHYACLAQGNEAGLAAAEAAGFPGQAASFPNIIEPAEEPLRALWRIPSRGSQKSIR
jgi:hypothetical protein